MSLQFQTNITIEQLYDLLEQLTIDEKIELNEKLRAEIFAQTWEKATTDLEEEPDISMEEIIEEVKIVRQERYEKHKS